MATQLASTYADLSLFIGGEWLTGDGRKTSPVINPATEEVIGHLPHASKAALGAASESLRGELRGTGVHVMTVNDYLARRDAAWMRPVYNWFGLSVGHISQDMSAAERRAAHCQHQAFGQQLPYQPAA